MSDKNPIAERRSRDIGIGNKLRRASFSAKTQAWVDLQAIDGLDWREAARRAGIKVKTARYILGRAEIRKALQERAKMVRTTEATRNPALAAKIRDIGLEEGASAADRRNSLEAMRYLEAPQNPATVNIGAVINTPGLVINLGAFGPPPDGVNGRPMMINATPDCEEDER